MKRIHIGLSVNDLGESVRYYSALFGEGPVVQEQDYAKWTPAEPAVNLSVTTRAGGEAGPVHFGIDVTSMEELDEVAQRLDDKGIDTADEGETVCCYHRSTKTWSTDPDRHAWEVFFTSSRESEFGKGSVITQAAGESSTCCDETCCGAEQSA